MADNQYKRRIAVREDDYATDDPLAELARVVGYDPRRGESSQDGRESEHGMDLEAELLQELSDMRGDGEADEAVAVAAPLAAAEEPHSDGVDHVRLSEEIGVSLEDELMRELGGGHDGYAEDLQADEEPETAGLRQEDDGFGQAAAGEPDVAILPESIVALAAPVEETVAEDAAEPASEPELETAVADEPPADRLRTGPRARCGGARAGNRGRGRRRIRRLFLPFGRRT